MLIKNAKKVLNRLNYFIPRFELREKTLNFLDHLIFRLNTTKYLVDKPRLDYQPLPWVGIPQAEIRGEATYARWEQIEKTLPKLSGKTALDIGSCYGFFSIKMAELGYNVLGIDLNHRHIKISRYAVPSILKKQCNFLEIEITPSNIDFLPPSDYILLLSVWHHWVYNFGLSEATKMLEILWNKTRDSIYFETGEGEVIDEFKLPFNKENPRQWISSYLEKTCINSTVRIISEHEVGNYEHYTSKKTTRALFLIRRKS